MLCERSPVSFKPHSCKVEAGAVAAVGPIAARPANYQLLESSSTASSYVGLDNIYSSNSSSKNCSGSPQQQQAESSGSPVVCFSSSSNQKQEKQEQDLLGLRSPSVKGKRIQHISSDVVDDLIKALDALSLDKDYWSQTAIQVQSEDPVERYEGTKRFRMLLSVSGEIPIQAVIDTGVVPKLVEFISERYDDSHMLQFEAAWALTNIASGTESQTEIVVSADAISHFIHLLDSSREDIREQGLWGLGNIAGDRAEFRDYILNSSHDAILKCVSACRRSKRESSRRTGVWSLSNLCRGKPRPKLTLIAPVIPFMAQILCCSDDCETLSDACWALDGISEQVDGVATLLANNLLPLLLRMITHEELMVQRPALRVIGQVAAGTVEQTQQVVDAGVLSCLKDLLKSPRKSIRKDSCWTLSNVAAGSSSQLQAVLASGVIPILVELFTGDSEVEVRKEAAWVICNACTSQSRDHLEYLVGNRCVEPICEMLRIDDPKILEVALESLENILEFGSQMQKLLNHPANICLELVRQSDGLTNLLNLHSSISEGSFNIFMKTGKLLDKWVWHNKTE